MYALFIVLNLVDYLDEILEAFVEAGVGGATIVDSQGMGSALMDSSKDVPVFGLLNTFLNDCKPYNKTIFSVMESEEMVDTVVALVKDILGKDAKPGAGFMFSMPIGKVYHYDDA